MRVLGTVQAPFLKSNDMETLDLIKRNPRVKFPGERWAHISQVGQLFSVLCKVRNPACKPNTALPMYLH